MTDDKKVDWDKLQAEAAEWLSGLDCGTRDRGDFEAWRAADPRHAVAFAQIANVTRTLDRVKPAYRLLETSAPKRNRRQFLWVGAGIAASAAAAATTWFLAGEGRETVQTKVGGRQSISLPAGGNLALNTDSKAQWRADRDSLEVWLVRGEMALDLRTSTVPCLLRAAGKTVTLESSQINARLRGDLLDIAVESGACLIEQGRGLAESQKNRVPLLVMASHAVLASADRAVVRQLDSSEMDFLSAWPKGEVAFQGQTLSTVVGEYNRYLDQKIVIADPSIADIRLGGRFTTTDPKPFLQALHAGFGINVSDDGAGTIALTR